MKRSIYSLFAVVVLLTACGKGKKETTATITDKKVKLEKLKSEQRKIGDQISTLEAEIATMDPSASAGSARLISIMPLAPQSFTHYIELQGKVDAVNISYVAPPNGQGGVVKALYITQGQSVRKGQVLARLDDQLIRQQIAPLQAQLNAAEDTYRRTKNLWDQGIGTYQQVLTAQTQVETLKRNIGVLQKQASLMTVTAPTAGVIDQLNVKVGEFFGGMTPVPQIRIVNTNNMKIVASVPENYLNRVHVGSHLLVFLPEQNNMQLDAVVNVVQKVIDPNTRSFNIEAKIPSGNLKANQIAKIRIQDYNNSNVIVIPVNLVQTDEKGKYVYVAEKKADKMIASKRSIFTGETYNGMIEVKSGLNAGDQLITEGYQNLYEGQVVSVTIK
jgi:membrane fusion protein, multidrug efflux system